LLASTPYATNEKEGRLDYDPSTSLLLPPRRIGGRGEKEEKKIGKSRATRSTSHPYCSRGVKERGKREAVGPAGAVTDRFDFPEPFGRVTGLVKRREKTGKEKKPGSSSTTSLSFRDAQRGREGVKEGQLRSSSRFPLFPPPQVNGRKGKGKTSLLAGSALSFSQGKRGRGGGWEASFDQKGGKEKEERPSSRLSPHLLRALHRRGGERKRTQLPPLHPMF